MLILIFSSLVPLGMAARVRVAKVLQHFNVQEEEHANVQSSRSESKACSGSKFEITVGADQLANCGNYWIASDVFTFTVRVGIPDIYSKGSKVSEHVVGDKISYLLKHKTEDWRTPMPLVLCIPDLPKDLPVKSMEVQFKHVQPYSINPAYAWPAPWYCGLGTAVDRISRDDKLDMGWTDPQPLRVTIGQSATAKWCSPSQTSQTCPCKSGNPFEACSECPCPVANIPYKVNGTDVVPEMILRKAWITMESVDMPKQIDAIQMDDGGPVAVGMVQGHTVDINDEDLIEPELLIDGDLEENDERINEPELVEPIIERVDTTVSNPEWCSGCRVGFCDVYDVATIRSPAELDGMRLNLAQYCSAKKCDQCTDAWEECDGHPGATPGCSDAALDGMKELKQKEFTAEVERLVEIQKQVQKKRQEEEQQLASKCFHFFSQKACGVKMYSNGKFKIKEADKKKSCQKHCASVEATEHFKCELDIFFTGEGSGELHFERNGEAVNKRRLMDATGKKVKKTWCTWQPQVWYKAQITGESMIDKDGYDCTDAWRVCSPEDPREPCDMSRTTKINGIACKVVEKDGK